MIAGKDKGTVGTITRVLTTTGKCVVEGVNIKTKHIAPRTENETGSIKKAEYPIHHSNVMLYSKEKGVRSRVGHKVSEDGTKVGTGTGGVEGEACDFRGKRLGPCSMRWGLFIHVARQGSWH